MKYCIKGGHVISPGNNLDEILDIEIEDGKISALQKEINAESGETKIIDARGKWVVPGLIDLHVHFRDPGQTYKEDIFTGLKAAAAGGVTTVCCMPNTSPVLDNKAVVAYVDEKGQRGCGVNLFVVSAITRGLEGKALVNFEELVSMDSLCRRIAGRGIAAISDDGKSVADERLMLKAMKHAAEYNLPVFSHAEEEVATVKRDIGLAEKAGGHLHFCHISTKEAVDAIRKAKAQGMKITAETAPHYFTLTEEFLKGTGGRGKVNPPLRTARDREAVIEGLRDGTIDAIATDHAPHSFAEKEGNFEESRFGLIGLETSFSLSFTMLAEKGLLAPVDLIRKMSAAPAEILGIERGMIEEGKTADLAVFDVDTEYEVNPEKFFTKGRSTPYAGMRLKGRCLQTFVNGRLIYNDGSFNRKD